MRGFVSRIALIFVHVYGVLPWWILRLSAVVWAFILTYLIRYRSKVINDNLKLVGAKGVSLFRIYENLCMLAFESLKLHSASIKSIERRVDYENLEVLQNLFSKGKNVVMVGGHMANWEMYSLSLPDKVQFDTYAVYKKLNNEMFDRAIKKSRSRTGMQIVEMNELRQIVRSNSDKPKLISLVFDQRPLNAQQSWWSEFLGIETPVYQGMEKISSILDAAVVYAAIRRVEGGRYVMNLQLVEEDLTKVEPGIVIDKCLGILEKEILKAPESWLWSHRRWKHKRPENMILHERKISKFEGWG